VPGAAPARTVVSVDVPGLTAEQITDARVLLGAGQT
jgi:hypothetical protein